MKKYIVATIKDWHIDTFNQKKDSDFKGWVLIQDPKYLTVEFLNDFNPTYIFFPHWSWIVSKEITDNFNCVCFHSSDVPYGRGGSPIQNLIIRGHTETKISALKMVQELDAGPVYCKNPLSLKGAGQEVFERSASIIGDMMKWIADNDPIPVKQEGEPTVFARRKNQDNQLPKEGDLNYLYNHIRMLDVKTYPSSYINYGDFTLDFSDANLNEEFVDARIRIRKNV